MQASSSSVRPGLDESGRAAGRSGRRIARQSLHRPRSPYTNATARSKRHSVALLPHQPDRACRSTSSLPSIGGRATAPRAPDGT